MAEVKGKKKENLFESLLTRKSADLESETAAIISRGVRTSYSDIMRAQVTRIDELTLELKKKKNINISNNLQDASRIDDKAFDGKSWAVEYDKLTQELALAKAKVKISDANYEELFGESYLKKEGVTA